MKRLEYMAWLASQAADGLTLLWPVTLALALLTGFALLWDVRSKRLRFRRRMLCSALPAVATLFILLVGRIFEGRPGLSFLPHVGFGMGILLSLVTVFVLRPA